MRQRFDTEVRLRVREMQAVCMKVVTSSSVASPKFFWGAKYHDLEQRYFIWTLPVKAQNDKTN